MTQTIAYLINQYPKVSHSFIRREIAGVESWGVRVVRYAIRSCESELVDACDRSELARTRIILGVGFQGLLWALFRVILTRPFLFLKTLALSLRLGRKSEKRWWLHVVYLAEGCVLLQWCLEAGVSHIHAHFGTNATTVAMLCRALGGPAYSFTVHGPEEFDAVNALSLVEKVKQSEFVVAVSHFGKSQLCRWCPQDQWSKMHVVHCGLDPSFLEQPSGPIPEEPHLVCVGRLCEQKGPLLLIEAVRQLSTEGVPFSLVLVGDGPMRSQIEAAIAKSHLQNQIKITGWASAAEVQHQINMARALVLPSFAEGLPVVLMEAMALGRPVISTYVAGIPELVEPSVSGWLVPAGSVSDLVTVLRHVLKTPSKDLAQMGQAGAERVCKYHDQRIESHKLVKLFGQYSRISEFLAKDVSVAVSGNSSYSSLTPSVDSSSNGHD